MQLKLKTKVGREKKQKHLTASMIPVFIATGTEVVSCQYMSAFVAFMDITCG